MGTVSTREPEGKNQMKDLAVNGITLKWILKKLGEKDRNLARDQLRAS
jgi:hypothetical protein